MLNDLSMAPEELHTSGRDISGGADVLPLDAHRVSWAGRRVWTARREPRYSRGMPRHIEVQHIHGAVRMTIRGYDVNPEPDQPAQWDLRVELTPNEAAELARDLTAEVPTDG